MLDVIGQRQQDLLSLLLERKDGLTIDQMATSLGITRTAVREHVAALERDRLVAPRAFAVTRGRPGRLYALTTRGMSVFPKHYDLMARLLLENLTARLGAAQAQEELRGLGEKLAAQFKARVGAGTLAQKANAIALLMRELGYESSAPNEEAATIEALNCVYHDLAKADPTVCTLDLALIENLADADIEHRACMARGDNSCVFCLKPR
jgi:DeoR family transcriptional regulator, suf operon transcriptional repressor